jgi:hypothetical protein
VCGSLVLLWSAGNSLAQFLHTLTQKNLPARTLTFHVKVRWFHLECCPGVLMSCSYHPLISPVTKGVLQYLGQQTVVHETCHSPMEILLPHLLCEGCVNLTESRLSLSNTWPLPVWELAFLVSNLLYMYCNQFSDLFLHNNAYLQITVEPLKIVSFLPYTLSVVIVPHFEAFHKMHCSKPSSHIL